MPCTSACGLHLGRRGAIQTLHHGHKDGMPLSRDHCAPDKRNVCSCWTWTHRWLQVIFSVGRFTWLCALDLVQQPAISREPLINSLGTGNCDLDQNIFSLGFSRKETRKLFCCDYGRPRNLAVGESHFFLFFLKRERTATQNQTGCRPRALEAKSKLSRKKASEATAADPPLPWLPACSF